MGKGRERKLYLPGTVFRKRCFEWALLSIAAFVFIASRFFVFGCATLQAKEIKDTINQLSFSHDGKKVLFDRCRAEICQIQVYDLATGELSAYQSPSEERWTMARYSDDGRKIVFAVYPIKEGYVDFGGMQIAVMDPEGRNVRRITSGYGAKIYPTFSHSGKKVLYAKGTYIRKRGIAPATHFDAWEVDLETDSEKRLTYFKFLGMTYLAYLPDDKRFICNAGWPHLLPGGREGDWKEIQKRNEPWNRKYMANTIHVLHEGQSTIDAPYMIVGKEIFNQVSRNPLLSKDGTRLFFEGHVGKYYLYSPDGNHRFVGGGGSVNSAAISPDGELLGTISVHMAIDIFRVKDGKRLEEVYAPSVQNAIHFKNILSSLKLLPELPSIIINR